MNTMFVKPEVGKLVEVRSMNAPEVWLRRENVYVGKVLPSDKNDDPFSFRMENKDNRYFPERVISLDVIHGLRYVDGKELERVEKKQPLNKEWRVKNSKGDGHYLVSSVGNNWSCTCKGYQFRRSCRHINKIKETIQNV